MKRESIRVTRIDLGTTNSTVAQMFWDVAGVLSDVECTALYWHVS